MGAIPSRTKAGSRHRPSGSTARTAVERTSASAAAAGLGPKVVGRAGQHAGQRRSGPAGAAHRTSDPAEPDDRPEPCPRRRRRLAELAAAVHVDEHPPRGATDSLRDDWGGVLQWDPGGQGRGQQVGNEGRASA